MTGQLVVISGLPGVGKTTAAELLASRLGLVHLSVDPVEDALLSCGLPPGEPVGIAAYEAVRAMAEFNLRQRLGVVVDAVNDSAPARETWQRAAQATGAELVFVFLNIADLDAHERRLVNRDRGFSHVSEPSWEAVNRRRATYEDWPDTVLTIDAAASSPDGIADAIIRHLSNDSSARPSCNAT